MAKIRSNLKRCPFLKVVKKEIKYNETGQIISEQSSNEFNDCYKEYCMAWDEASKSCKCLSTQFMIDED